MRHFEEQKRFFLAPGVCVNGRPQWPQASPLWAGAMEALESFRRQKDFTVLSGMPNSLAMLP